MITPAVVFSAEGFETRREEVTLEKWTPEIRRIRRSEDEQMYLLSTILCLCEVDVMADLCAQNVFVINGMRVRVMPV